MHSVLDLRICAWGKGSLGDLVDKLARVAGVSLDQEAHARLALLRGGSGLEVPDCCVLLPPKTLAALWPPSTIASSPPLENVGWRFESTEARSLTSNLSVVTISLPTTAFGTAVLAALGWATISALATAGGTLVLAIATFASVRSANRAARTAELAFQVGLRPVLFSSRPDDQSQLIRWGDDHWADLAGGGATVEEVDQNLYMAMSIRNVGSGIAVLHSWHVGPMDTSSGLVRPPTEAFRPQQRDLYVPPNDMSFWQAAIRDRDDPDREAVVDSIESGQGILVDILYSDHEGGQRTISRFHVTPRGKTTDWLCYVVRHWNLDRPDPR